MITLDDIKGASERLQGVIKRTELQFSRSFSNSSGHSIYLKAENLQRTGSFKIRGAYNKICNLNINKRDSGVVAASAGNHAQGVALAASLAGIDATIVMPKGAPIAKIEATKGYGARVILSGETYDDAYIKAKEYAEDRRAIIIPAFDDKDVIAGQGTIGLEIIEDLPQVDVVVAPVGGGGLLSGIAVAIKETDPNIEVIGVEAAGAASMKASLENNRIMVLTKVNTIADGIAVKEPGQLTYSIIKDYVDKIITVDDEEIAHAISMLLERTKLMVEGAGATGLAAVLNNKISGQGKNVVVVLSGGNIDLDMISIIIDRGMIKAGRRIALTTFLPDIPGSLQKLLGIISKVGANVISINHDRLNPDIALKQAEVELILETRDVEHINKVLSLLGKEGYDLRRIR